MIVINIDNSYMVGEEDETKHYEGELKVCAASMLIGIERSRLILDAGSPPEAEKEGDPPPEIPSEYWLRKIVYPDLISSTREGCLKINGVELDWPLSFETFLNLPEPIGREWERAVYELNPHWLEADTVVEKKA